MKIPQKRHLKKGGIIKSRINVLKTLALKGPSKKYSIEKNTSLSHGTVHETVKRLFQDERLQVLSEGKWRTGLPTRTYGLTLSGLALAFEDDDVYKRVDDVVERWKHLHPPVLGKWEYFKQRGLGGEAKELLQIGASLFNVYLAAKTLEKRKPDQSVLQSVFTRCFFDPLLPNGVNSILRSLGEGQSTQPSFNHEEWVKALYADKDLRTWLISTLRKIIAQRKAEIKRYEKLLRNIG